MAALERQGRWGTQGWPAGEDFLEKREHQDLRENKDHQEPPEPQGHRAREECVVSLDPEDLLVYLELREGLVSPEDQV